MTDSTVEAARRTITRLLREHNIVDAATAKDTILATFDPAELDELARAAVVSARARATDDGRRWVTPSFPPAAYNAKYRDLMRSDRREHLRKNEPPTAAERYEAYLQRLDARVGVGHG